MAMNEAEYEAYLRDFIPITQAMDFRIERYSAEEAVVRAAIEPNKSRKGMAFGGSIASLCLAAAWSLLRFRLEQDGIDATIVIQKAETRYLDPIEKDFKATASMAEGTDWDRFSEMIRRLGKGRVGIDCVVTSGDVVGARFFGRFVAIREG